MFLAAIPIEMYRKLHSGNEYFNLRYNLFTCINLQDEQCQYFISEKICKEIASTCVKAQDAEKQDGVETDVINRISLSLTLKQV